MLLYFHNNTRTAFYWNIEFSGTPSGSKLIKGLKILFLSTWLCDIIKFFLKSFLTLKLYLNLLVYDQNILRSWKSLVILGHLWKSLVIFKLSENVWKLLCGHLTTFGEALKIFKKWLEIFRKSSKYYGGWY